MKICTDEKQPRWLSFSGKTIISYSKSGTLVERTSMALTVIRQLAESRINPSEDDTTRNQNNWRQRICYNGDSGKREQSFRSVYQVFTAFKNCQNLELHQEICQKLQHSSQAGFSSCISKRNIRNNCYSIYFWDGIGKKLGLRTESDDAREGYGIKTDFVTGVDFSTESNRKNWD